MNRAVFLDRDGVLNAMVFKKTAGILDSPSNPNEFHLLPGAVEAVKLINGMRFLAVVVSNQPGIAKGKFNLPTIQAMTEKMEQGLSLGGATLNALYYCFHHPEGVVAEFRKVCSCRKPAPGMLLEAARALSIDLGRSYMVGDSPKDVRAGQAAGCRTFLVDGHDALNSIGPSTSMNPNFSASDLLSAVRHIQRLEQVV